MRTGDYLKSHEGTLTENKWSRVVNGSLSFAVLVLAIIVFGKDEIVVIQPETLGSEAWITRNNSSHSYKESWGLYLALLSGNVTPDSGKFIKDHLKPLLSPRIYNDILDALETQIQAIRDDRISIRFEARAVSYEPDSDKVFVYGFSYVKGPTGDEQKEERTYEYAIRIDHYAPMIVDLNTYEGKPRVLKVLKQMEQEENVRSRNDD